VPLLRGIRECRELATVLVGELVPRWVAACPASHHALELKAAPLFEPEVAVASIPQRL
jgi:hypothetical protein